jgi:hypothetical protein
MFNINKDTVGQSTVIGATLLIALMIVVSGIYVSQAIPDIQRNEEQNNELEIKESANQIPSKISLTAATDTTQAVTLSANVNYTTFFITPLPAVVEPPEPIIEVNNIDQHSVTVSGSTTESVNSDVIAIRPKYYRYSVKTETVYSQQLIYNYTIGSSRQAVDPSPQYLINDTNITVYNINNSELNGNMVNMTMYNQNTTTVDVINTSSNSVSITMESDLTADQWNELLNDELTENGGHVESISQIDSETVEITLENGQEYSYTEHTIDIRGN